MFEVVFDNIFDFSGRNSRHVVPTRLISAPVRKVWKGRWRWKVEMVRKSSHDGIHPTVRLCSFLYTFTNLVANPTDSVVLCSSIALTSKSLEECAMYAMLRHPIEMSTPHVYPRCERQTKSSRKRPTRCDEDRPVHSILIPGREHMAFLSALCF